MNILPLANLQGVPKSLGQNDLLLIDVNNGQTIVLSQNCINIFSPFFDVFLFKVVSLSSHALL